MGSVVSPTERAGLHASRVNFPQAAQIESVLRRGGTQSERGYPSYKERGAGRREVESERKTVVATERTRSRARRRAERNDRRGTTKRRNRDARGARAGREDAIRASETAPRAERNGGRAREREEWSGIDGCVST